MSLHEDAPGLGKNPAAMSGADFLSQITEQGTSPSFTQDALNALNRAYYTHRYAFRDVSYNFFTGRNFQTVLSNEIERLNLGTDLRIKELSNGPAIRWEHLRYPLLYGNTHVILTDFDISLLPTDEQLVRKRLDPQHFSREVYSLTDVMPTLPTEERVDLMLITYGFDSIWLPQDIRYVKNGDTWYQTLYRLNIPENLAFEEQEQIRAVLRGEVDSNSIPLRLLAAVEIEESLEEVDMTTRSFGQQILNRYGHLETAAINVPGGLIQRVIEAFDNQIAEGGAFIIGDTAVDDQRGYSANTNSPAKSYLKLPEGAIYRQDDYGLAKAILEDLGYDVEIQNAVQGPFKYIFSEMVQQTTKDELMMTIRRKKSQI